jgi:uncharacterized protein YecT (DUF1311 family)
MRRGLVLTVLLALWGGTARAQAVDCSHANDQFSMNICADRDYQIADKTLNDTYRRLMASVSPAGRSKLQAAQRAWLAWRDAECQFETAGSADGSIHPYVVSICRNELTRAQATRLDRQLHCQEGDLSCGRQ